MHQFSRESKKAGKRIGFVPTMGYLHNGHISLLEKSKSENDISVVSIFVNPSQFGPAEDFSKYPRNLERDKEMLIDAGCDILFYPKADDVYPDDFQTTVQVGKISNILEGKFRPGHFNGVTTIVSILFNCVIPDVAYFGQKDAQQAAVIKQMVKDLKYDIEINVCPIIRETDGLAMSSRNIYLSPEERIEALVLRKSLLLAVELIYAGEKDTSIIKTKMKEMIFLIKSASLDYVEVVEADSFLISSELKAGKQYFILIACKIGTTRLIDNELIIIPF